MAEAAAPRYSVATFSEYGEDYVDAHRTYFSIVVRYTCRPCEGVHARETAIWQVDSVAEKHGEGLFDLSICTSSFIPFPVSRGPIMPEALQAASTIVWRILCRPSMEGYGGDHRLGKAMASATIAPGMEPMPQDCRHERPLRPAWSPMVGVAWG